MSSDCHQIDGCEEEYTNNTMQTFCRCWIPFTPSVRRVIDIEEQRKGATRDKACYSSSNKVLELSTQGETYIPYGCEEIFLD
jgi:hypothetical protein